MATSKPDQNNFKAGDTLKCNKCEFELKIVTMCDCTHGAPELTCCGQPLVCEGKS